MKRIIVTAIMILLLAMIMVVGQNIHNDNNSSRLDYLVNDLFNGTKYHGYRSPAIWIFNADGSLILESRSLGASMTNDGYSKCQGSWSIVGNTLQIRYHCSNGFYTEKTFLDYRYWKENSVIFLSPVSCENLKEISFDDFITKILWPEGGLLMEKE